MSDNEYNTKGNKSWTKDKIEPQHNDCTLWFNFIVAPIFIFHKENNS